MPHPRSRRRHRHARQNPWPAHAISDPGRGKTTALRNLAREYNGLYLEIGDPHKDVAGLYRGLLEAADRWYDPYDVKSSSRRHLCDLVVTEYQRRVAWSEPHKELLVVDEFQTAEDRIPLLLRQQLDDLEGIVGDVETLIDYAKGGSAMDRLRREMAEAAAYARSRKASAESPEDKIRRIIAESFAEGDARLAQNEPSRAEEAERPDA